MTFSIFQELSEKFQINVSCFDILTPKGSLVSFLLLASTIQINTKTGQNLHIHWVERKTKKKHVRIR
jgi:hypothetical protein